MILIPKNKQQFSELLQKYLNHERWKSSRMNLDEEINWQLDQMLMQDVISGKLQDGSTYRKMIHRLEDMTKEKFERKGVKNGL